MPSISERLDALGIDLPAGPAPAAEYVPWVISRGQLYIAGQIAREDETFLCGQIQEGDDLAAFQHAARACGLAILSHARQALGGDLDRIMRVVRIGGFVNAAADFTQHASVMNGCSELMVEVFGEPGRHVRAAVGCSSLPRGVMVEADAVFELRDQ